MTWPRSVYRSLMRTHETGWTFALGVALVYVAWLIVGHVHHEMWRDEIHSWTVARQADGFWDLVTGDRVYEGHPPFWFWYLRVWTFLTRRSWGIHAATIAAMGTAAFLFLRHAPFPRFLKVLLLGSYLLGFEYGVISRNYSTTWLLVVIFCCLLQPLRPRFIVLAAVLGMLALTSAFGAFISCALAVMLVPLGMHMDRPEPATGVVTLRANPWFLVGAAGFIVALGFFAWSTAPPDPNYNTPDWLFQELKPDNFKYAVRRVVHAFMPVRLFRHANYWQDYERFWNLHTTLTFGVGLGLLALIVVSLLPGWFEIVGLLLGYLVMSVFTMIRYGSEIRHLGNLFLLFIAAAWIHRLKEPRRNHAVSTVLLLICAGFQLESFAAAASNDWKYAFSGGREMARWIEDEHLQDMTIVAGPDALVLTVTSYLDRQFISSQTEEINVTQVFHSRRRGFTAQGLVERAAREVREKHKPVLVLTTGSLPNPGGGLELELLKKTHGGLGEEFDLYRMQE
jgi:hypothetical protein